MEEFYFDPFRKNHIEFIKYLQQELSEDVVTENNVVMCKFGEKTEHIFINNIYLMTIDWTKI